MKICYNFNKSYKGVKNKGAPLFGGMFSTEQNILFGIRFLFTNDEKGILEIQKNGGNI